MTTFTLDDLQAALGDNYTLECFGDDQAHIQFRGGSIGFISLEDYIIETDINAFGSDIQQAQESTESLREELESFGFSVDDGSVSEHAYKSDPEKKYSHVEFAAKRTFDGLDDVVRIFQWLVAHNIQEMQ